HQDDPPLTRLPQVGKDLPGHRHRAEEVRLEDLGDLRGRQVLEVAAELDAGVVDEAVDPARTGQHGGDRRAHAGRVGDVEPHDLHARAAAGSLGVQIPAAA